MSPVALVLYVLAAAVALFVAFRLDEMRNATGQSLWRLAVERFSRGSTGPPQQPDNPRRRRQPSLASVLPLVLVAAVLATGMWWAGSSDDSTPGLTDETAARDGAPSSATATPASSDAIVSLEQDLSGAEATEVAVALSREAFPNGEAENVLLARQQPSVDALVAGGLQGLLDGPLLLTTPDSISPETAAEIDRLGRPSVHILGGEQAVSSAIEAQLVAAGHDVHRHAGTNGIATAIDIAARHFPDAEAAILAPSFGADTEATEVLARALTAGGVAAARQQPVLLTNAGGLSPITSSYLQGSFISRVLIVGSEEEISPAVMQDLAELGVSATRVAGEDRYATAVAVSGADGFTGAGDVILLAEGSGDTLWPGISIAAVFAGREDAPIVLSNGDALPDATRSYLEARSGDGVEVECMPRVAESACVEARNIVTS